MILSAQSIRKRCAEKHDSMIHPFVERSVVDGRSFGLSSAGYDICVDKFATWNNYNHSIVMRDGDFVLASSLERIKMPNDLIAIVHDKSSWAREGLALQNTVLEPGWEGYITLELSFHRPAHHITIKRGDPIAQLIFHKLDEPTEHPYRGKYQNQEDRPIEARREE